MQKHHKLPKETLKYWLVNETISLFIFSIVLIGIRYFLLKKLGDYHFLINISFGVLVLYMLIDSYIHPFIKFKNWSYLVTPDKVEYEYGIYVKKRTIVPIVKIQHVTLIEGPINKKFGLSIVQLTTTNGSHKIEAIPTKEAIEIGNLLNEQIIKKEKALDVQTPL